MNSIFKTEHFILSIIHKEKNIITIHYLWDKEIFIKTKKKPFQLSVFYVTPIYNITD